MSIKHRFILSQKRRKTAPAQIPEEANEDINDVTLEV